MPPTTRRPSGTALVMADNREPRGDGGGSYPALAFALNALYAARHGYALLYYRMASPSCTHATQGSRHASYCKLPAIAHALQPVAHSHHAGPVVQVPAVPQHGRQPLRGELRCVDGED